MVVTYYFIAVVTVAVIMLFTNGIVFSLCLVGTSMIPCISTAAIKWGILKGNRKDRVWFPILALIPLGFSYWLSSGVSLQAFGYHLSGLALAAIGMVVGIVGVPLSWGNDVMISPERRELDAYIANRAKLKADPRLPLVKAKVLAVLQSAYEITEPLDRTDDITLTDLAAIACGYDANEFDAAAGFMVTRIEGFFVLTEFEHSRGIGLAKLCAEIPKLTRGLLRTTDSLRSQAHFARAEKIRARWEKLKKDDGSPK